MHIDSMEDVYLLLVTDNADSQKFLQLKEFILVTSNFKVVKNIF